VLPFSGSLIRSSSGYLLRLSTDQQVTRTRTRQQNTRQQNKLLTHDKNNSPNPQTSTSHKQLTTLQGGATTVRATSHARVGGRAEVSVRDLRLDPTKRLTTAPLICVLYRLVNKRSDTDLGMLSDLFLLSPVPWSGFRRFSFAAGANQTPHHRSSHLFCPL